MRFPNKKSAMILVLILAGCGTNWDDNDVDPQPTPGAKLWVVVVESTSRLKARPDIENVLNGVKLREYCKSHCKAGPDGKTPEFRVYFDSQDVSRESPAIRHLFTKAAGDSKAKGIEPWIAFSDGRKVISQEVSAELESDGTPKIVSVLKKHGGE